MTRWRAWAFLALLLAVLVIGVGFAVADQRRFNRVKAWFIRFLPTLGTIAGVGLIATIFALLTWRWVATRGSRLGPITNSVPAFSAGGGGTCGSSETAVKGQATCGAQDPVSDPDYNMREIVKQSILLEEHLVEKNKRCTDCIAKHFLHIIALAEEAQCLAGSGIKQFPLMDDSPGFYKKLFDHWLSHRDNDDEYRRIDDQLRARRKQLVAIYVLGPKKGGPRGVHDGEDKH